MKDLLVKETLNEEIGMGAAEGDSLVINQAKNVLKNVQALLDLLNTGQVLTPEEGAKLAVVDNQTQEIKNRVENAATEVPGEETAMEVPLEEPVPLDDAPIEELPPPPAKAEPEGDIIEPIGMEELPPAFPEDEVEDDGEFDVEANKAADVTVLDVETKYEDEVE